MAKLEPIDARSKGVADSAAEEILKRIAGGDVSAGEKLPSERKLAEQLGVSRVSVRAGLQRLKAQGFLDAVQGGGTRVVAREAGADPALAELVRLDTANMLDLMDLRCEMEVWAARRAAESASDCERKALVAAHARMSDGNMDRAQADMAFHMAVARASNSVVYRHLLSLVRGTLTQMLTFHRQELFATPEDDERVLAQHCAIVERIQDRDPDGAANAMRVHLDWARDHYTRKGLNRRDEG